VNAVESGLHTAVGVDHRAGRRLAEVDRHAQSVGDQGAAGEASIAQPTTRRE
jgi:hypothetical protein